MKLSILAFVFSLSALVFAALPRRTDWKYNAPQSTRNAQETMQKLQELESKLANLDRTVQALLRQPRSSSGNRPVAAAETEPAGKVQDRIKQLEQKQEELAEANQNIDRLGIIRSMEGEVHEAYNNLMDNTPPGWARIKQIDQLKRFGMFDGRAADAMIDMFYNSNDFDDKAAALHALRDRIGPEFRDDILQALHEEYEQGNPAPKFRALAAEVLTPMMPDRDIEEWMHYIAENDPEPRVQAHVEKVISSEVSREEP